MSEQPGRYQRSAGGMIGAMVVLVVVVLGFVVLRDLNRTNPEATVKPVDYRQTLDYAREQVDLPLLAPESLPAGWRATSVQFVPEPPRWHLGLLTEEDRYVGLEQAARSEQNMVEDYVDEEAVRGKPVQIDGQTWRTWTDEGGDTGLVRSEGDVTTLVVGTPDLEVLTAFVESLR